MRSAIDLEQMGDPSRGFARVLSAWSAALIILGAVSVAVLGAVGAGADTEDVLLHDPSLSNETDVDLAVDRQGSTLATWLSDELFVVDAAAGLGGEGEFAAEGGGPGAVTIRSFDAAGEPLSAETTIEPADREVVTDGPWAAAASAVATPAPGIVAWVVNSQRIDLVITSTGSGTPSEPISIQAVPPEGTELAASIDRLAVAAQPDGTGFVVAWTQDYDREGGSPLLAAATVSPAGSVGATVVLDEDPPETVQDWNAPSVTISPSGQVLVGAVRFESPVDGTWTRTLVAYDHPTGHQTVVVPPGQPIENAELAFTGLGMLDVVFSDGEQVLFGRRALSDTGALETEFLGWDDDPELAGFPGGESVVTWADDDRLDVVAVVVRSDGVPGTPIVIPTTAGLHREPSVAASAGRNYTIGWHGSGPGDENGAVARFLSLPPMLVDDFYTAIDTETLVVSAPGVLANDSVPAGSTAVLWNDGSEPPVGVLELDGDGGFTYEPVEGTDGPVTFTYSIDGWEVPATLTIDVEPAAEPPTAVDDSYATPQDTQLVVDAPGVLANDHGSAPSSLSANPVSQPAHGDMSMYWDGSFIYVPDDGFTGTDTFTYQAYDDGEMPSEPATVTITVGTPPPSTTTTTTSTTTTTTTAPPEDRPPVAADDTYRVSTGSQLAVPAPGVLGNDTDPDADALSAGLQAPPANGTVALTASGGFAYEPNEGFTGTDSFTYTASGGGASSAPATVRIIVSAPATGSGDDRYDMSEDDGLAVDAPGVLSNDQSSGLPQLVDEPTFGSVIFYADGAFVYAPGPDFTGFDQFTYTAAPGTASARAAAPDLVGQAAALAPNASIVTIAVADRPEPEALGGAVVSSPPGTAPDGGSSPADAPASDTTGPDADGVALPPLPLPSVPPGPASDGGSGAPDASGGSDDEGPALDEADDGAAADALPIVEYQAVDEDGFDDWVPRALLLALISALFILAVVIIYRTIRGPADPFTGKAFQRRTKVPMVAKSYKLPRGLRSAPQMHPPAAVAGQTQPIQRATDVAQAPARVVDNPSAALGVVSRLGAR